MRERKQPLEPEGILDVQPNSVSTGPVLNRDIQTKIGQQLRAIYDDVVDQGVPDRFVELLRNLEREKGKGDRGDEAQPNEP